jgi:RimJ/RimL family protein N-acetyltransferase
LLRDAADMTERSEHRVLMPSSAPPAEIPPPQGSTRSAEGRAARAGRVRDAREVATLEGQLRGLAREIRGARRTTRRTAAVPGLELLRHEDRAARDPGGERVRLRDGAVIVIRQVEPGDAAELNAGFERLGALSRYRRFLTSLDHLSPEQVSYLTHVDHTSHEAIGALDAATGEGVGIARYVRDRADPQQADVAIVVTDAWQGRGVGTVLAERLAARARAANVERITARMIVGNDAARRLIAHVADTLTEERRPGTIAVTARLRG